MRWLAAALLLMGLAGGGAQSGAQPGSEVEDYLLGGEDVIRIQAWGRADLTTDAALDESGRVTLPLVGVVEAAGKTPVALGRYLTERYQLIDPKIAEILVTIVQYNSRAVTVVGELRNPGKYGFRVIPDLWAVLLKAGGATPGADLSHVQVVRGDDSVPAESRTVTIDLSKGIDRTDAAALPKLGPKDTVIVPSAAEGGVSGDKFHVLGAVRAPGSYKIQTAKTIVEAISVAGGELPEADLRKARLTRAGASGAFAYTLDLKSYLEEGAPACNLPIRAGDTISIPRKKGGAQSILEGVGRLVPVISLATSIVSLAVASR